MTPGRGKSHMHDRSLPPERPLRGNRALWPEWEPQLWVRVGYIFTGALLLFRLGYIASGVIELSNDEAYQWLWSKHLALSYFSKPPAIAFIQFAGTWLWGDTELGVRFFPPVFAAILSVVMLRFLAREVGARQAFLLL